MHSSSAAPPVPDTRDPDMTARILFFCPLVDLTGSASLEMALPDGATVGDLLGLLFEKWPALRPWDASLLTAVNLSYADRGAVIPPGAEVAVMPPVQGG